jgi:hypothetical protein
MAADRLFVGRLEVVDVQHFACSARLRGLGAESVQELLAGLMRSVVRWDRGRAGLKLNLRGFDRPDVKIIDFSLPVMKHYDLGFDQSSIDHRFENVAAARFVSTLFRIAQLRLIQPRYDNIPRPGDSHGSPLKSASVSGGSGSLRQWSGGPGRTSDWEGELGHWLKPWIVCRRFTYHIRRTDFGRFQAFGNT